VHFLGYSKHFDATIDRLSCDLQPLHTFTRAWRDRLKAGSKVEVRIKNDDTINHDVDDGGSMRCVWQKGVVVQIGREIAGDDAEEDADGDETKQQQDEQVEPSRMALVAVMASSTNEGCSGANTKKRWIGLDGEDVCQEGTHLSGSVADSSGKRAGISPSAPMCTSPQSPSARSASTSVGRAPSEPSYVAASSERASSRFCDTDNAASFAKRVALVGSSGGGAAAQGQFDGPSLLRLAKKELKRAGIHLSAVQFVACAEPLDLANPSSAATLWVAGTGEGDEALVVAAEGQYMLWTLLDVNMAARKEDVKIAAALREGCGGHDDAPIQSPRGANAATSPKVLPLHGLVAISCDVHGVNSEAFTAARDCRAPVVGTGGTSLGTALAMGCRLVGSSGGSVATTNKSKVVSYAAGLAGHWRLRYDSAKELMQPLAPAATFAGCLPVQVGVTVAVALGSVPTTGDLLDGAVLAAPWMIRLQGAIPVVAAAVAARQVSTLGDMATAAAGVIAGSLCMEDTLAALAAGTLAGYLCSKMTGQALDFGIPATALSLYATATSGIVSGAMVLFALPFLKFLGAIATSTDALLIGLQSAWMQALVGAGMGCLMCYGSKIGWYHRVFLPVIVLELARGEGGSMGSIWGAIDLCALCMVAAGLCAAHLLRPTSPVDAALGRRGLIFNLGFGDFIEAAYPFMERCRCCNAGAYMGSAISGAVVAAGGVASTAYLPLPLAIAACSKPWWLLGATSAAFLPAFALGLLRPKGK
ncbi:unnamed protein product, partial [Ectocarpus fasciculatus]